ncbi:transcription factor AP-4-like [Saccostrea echinata]|uniref:transcription factor AP-4-like n=1 Tax=Saccostrea echinata TaxID=191078 RepID=UPI002A81BEB5|nr:transcription factor AP-4-like [Saccostrea echinata]
MMSNVYRSSDRRKLYSEYELQREDLTAVLGRSQSIPGKPHMEHEKKMRREIANSNERRRMQSINAGFQSLKSLIPHSDGEKLSKAAILQQTSDYIEQLESDKTRLLAINNQLSTQLKRLLGSDYEKQVSINNYNPSPPTKRKKRDTESSDEGISADYEDINEIKREMIDLRCQLDRERHLRMMLQKQNQSYHLKQEHPTFVEHMQEKRPKDKVIYVESVESEEDEKLHERNSSDSESMSRRNLETIVEAIRHLEGDRLGINDRTTHHRGIPHSDESEKDSSVTCSEPEDRDSPIPFEKIDSRQSVSVTEVPLTEIHPHLSPSQYHEKFPIATNLLHRPNMVHYYCRPNVIVQKS